MLLIPSPGMLLPLEIVMFDIIALPSILTAKMGALLARQGRTET